MKSLYGQYILEREGMETIETEEGFATYRIVGEECYIRDLYILPKFRRNSIASQFADKVSEIAKEKGCKYLTGSVCTNAYGADDSVRTLLAYGMSLHSASNNMIYFKKEIK